MVINHAPKLKYAIGNRIIPDQPMNTNLSLFSQSSDKTDAPNIIPLLNIKLLEYILSHIKLQFLMININSSHR